MTDLSPTLPMWIIEPVNYMLDTTGLGQNPILFCAILLAAILIVAYAILHFLKHLHGKIKKKLK